MLRDEFFSDKKFLQLKEGSDGNKRPIKGFSNTLTFDEVGGCRHVGMLVESPHVILDVDNEDDFERLKTLLKNEHVQCHIMKTTRGGHFWFKHTIGLKNNVNINTPLTLRVDIRSHGRNSQVKVRDNGKWRKWVQLVDELDELPKWLEPIDHDVSLVGAKNGDGRNDKLFRYIITLTNKGLTKTEIRETFRLINKYLFADKMSDDEMANITRDGAFNKLKPAFFVKGRFLFDKFAHYFKSDNNVFQKFNRLYIYDGTHYVSDNGMIERKLIEYIPELSRSQRSEVMEYLKLIADEPNDIPIYYVIAKNGMIDIRTNGLTAFTEELFTPNKINTSFDSEAYNEDMDIFLNKVCCYDKEVRLLIEEMIGYILIPSAKFQKSFILYGDGSNGKSTLLDTIISLCGEDSISSLSMTELNHNFKLGMMTNKLANIGDDISDEYITDSSIFKKLVTGEEIAIDVKYGQPYKMRNHATLLFATNNLPNMSDKSNGMLRRLTVIPFNAVFSKNDIDYDPFIIDKLTTESAKSYLLNLAIKGIRRVFENNGFTDPVSVNKLLAEYEEEINNVIQFIKSRDTDFTGLASADLYSEYTFWCMTNNQTPYKIRRFNHEIRSKTNLELVVTRKGNKTMQVWTERS